MAKYPPSAPFFGMPYAAGFPPQSAPPPPPGPGHAFHNVPQMPPPPPHQHQAQNVSGFQQNASLPPVDFQALGLNLNPSQLAALWQQVQNGAAPPPPFPPPFTSPGFAPPPPPPIPFPAGFQPPGTPSFPIPHPQSLPGISSVPQPVLTAAAANTPAQNNRVMDIVNGDKEEGELSDEPGSQDDLGHSWVRDDSRRGNDRHDYGKKPRSPQWPSQRDRRSPVRTPRDRAHGENGTETSQRPVHFDRPEPKGSTSFPKSGQPAEKHGGFDRTVFEDQKRQAETFLTILHNCGYNYSDLQKCGFDPKLVREVWASLGFSLEQKAHDAKTRTPAMPAPVEAPIPRLEGKPHVAAPISSAVSPATSTQPSVSKPQPPVGIAGTNKQNAGASAPSPTDRAAYIARLMAAKNSKVNLKTAPTATSPTTPSPAPIASVVASAPRQPDPAPSVNVQETPKQEALPSPDPAALAQQKKEAQNELLRKKIELLKIPKKKAEEEARAKAQAVAASLSASRTSSSDASSAAPTKTEMPVRPAHQENAPAVSTSSKDVQTTPMPAQSPGGIPGLFMTAPTPQAILKPSQESAAPVNRGRKRPVAADFDDLQQSRAPTAFKRPFGQSHNDHEQMIIEPSVQRSSQSQPKQGTIRNMPPLTNFPARPNFSRQGSAQSTPPAVQTPTSAAKIENLRRKEEEIAALKKKLAEKERQRRAKAQSSRAPTPATPMNYQSQTPQQVSSPSAPVPKDLPQAQQSVSSEVALGVSTPTSAALTSTPQSPAESDWKRRRRAEIQSGISAFDADLYSNMSRLEQLRREMEKLEAENKRRQQEKETLINELENLGIDTEGMPHEELQAKKDEIMLQQQQEAQATAIAGASAEAADTASLALPAADQKFEAQKIGEKVPSDSSGEQMSMSDGEIEDESDTTEAEMDMSDSDSEKDEPVPIKTATEAVETSVSDSIKHPQTMLREEGKSKSASEQEDTEDFYSPEPVVETSKNAAQPEAQNAENPSAESSQQLSETNGDDAADDEDDYSPPESVKSDAQIFGRASGLREPVEQDLLTNALDTPMELSEPETESSHLDTTNADTAELDSGDASSEAMDEGEDDYDPSDMLPDASTSAAHTPYTASGDSMTGLSAPQSVTGSQVAMDSASLSANSASQTPQITIIADDVGPEPEGRAPEGDNGQSVPDPSDVKKQTFYTPYESPLTRFKSYRYHPQYSHSVSGGFKSLTYSHEIDPMKPVCPFETAGGICNDSACEGQHFRAMGISEDKILLQLGIVNPGRTLEEQERWRVGLKQVLKGLREQNVRDAESVAAAITTYRREFLKDPSRVLNISV